MYKLGKGTFKVGKIQRVKMEELNSGYKARNDKVGRKYSSKETELEKINKNAGKKRRLGNMPVLEAVVGRL